MLKYNIDCINPCTSNRSTPYRQCETNTPMASCHETTKCFTKKKKYHIKLMLLK